MRASITSFYITVFAVIWTLSAPAAEPLLPSRAAVDGGRSDPSVAMTVQTQPDTTDPEALYIEREDLTKARQAAEIWQARLKTDPKDFDAAWKLARARYWLGTHGPEAGRRQELEAGTAAGQTASTLAPSRPDGYFWMATNMGALAESFGMSQGIKYRKPIREALEKVLALDPAYLQGAADRALGRWYFKVPGLFGGSKQKSVEHLQKSFTYQADSTIGHYFLAETLLDMGRTTEARAELQKVLDAPITDDFGPEDREWKGKAQTLLAKTRH